MSIISNAKEIADLVKKYNDQELYQKLVSLREEILEIREENVSLKEEVKTLKEAQKISVTLIRKDNYYIKEGDIDRKEGIFCMSCWDYDNKLVNLHLGLYDTIVCNICVARKK